MPLDCEKTLELGIGACSRGDWEEGLAQLRRLKHQEGACGGLPGTFYSYLGVAMARCEGRMHEGLEWCTHAVAVEPCEPVNYLNLGRTYLVLNNSHGAMLALREGLAVDPGHAGLLELRRSLGIRRRLPAWFQARGHRLRLFLGRLRAKPERRVEARPRRSRIGDETTGIFRPGY